MGHCVTYAGPSAQPLPSCRTPCLPSHTNNQNIYICQFMAFLFGRQFIHTYFLCYKITYCKCMFKMSLVYICVYKYAAQSFGGCKLKRFIIPVNGNIGRDMINHLDDYSITFSRHQSGSRELPIDAQNAFCVAQSCHRVVPYLYT